MCRRSGRKRRSKQQYGDTYVLALSEQLEKSVLSSMDASERMAAVEKAMLAAASASSIPTHDFRGRLQTRFDNKVRELIAKRRSVATCTQHSPGGKRELRITIGKQIPKLILQKMAERRDAKISRILEEFRGLKRLPVLLGARRRTTITEIKSKTGNIETARGSIVGVFADFYAELYGSSGEAVGGEVICQGPKVPPFIESEMVRAMRALEAGKAKDKTGIEAEMMKAESAVCRTMLLELYNDILARNVPPKQWKTKSLL